MAESRIDNLVNIQPGTKYRYGAARLRDTEATVTHKFNSGVDSLADLANKAEVFPINFPGNTSLPLKTVDIVAQGGGRAVAVARYGVRTGRSRAHGGADLEVSARQAFSAEVAVTFNAPGAHLPDMLGKTEKRRGELIEAGLAPEPRKLRVSQHSISMPIVVAGAGPSNLVGYIDTLNMSDFKIDGVTYTPATLWFQGFDATHNKRGNYDEWIVRLKWLARADQWTVWSAKADNPSWAYMFPPKHWGSGITA